MRTEQKDNIMQTNQAVHSSKRGTIGYAINQLAKRFGGGTKGIYILEQALLKVCEAQRLSVDGGTSYYDTPGYKKHKQIEQAILQRVGDIPAAACGVCGGWTGHGGMSHYAHSTEPVDGRTGCTCGKAVVA